MRKMIGVTLALAATLATGAAAQGTNALKWTLGSQKRIWIEGTSTVRGFTCSTSTFTVAAQPAPADTAPLARALQTVDVQVPVKSLDCGNGTMEKHLRKALKAKDDPNIEFELKSYTVGEKTAAGTPVEATGTMTIAGSSKTVDLDGMVTPTATGLRVQGQKKLLMTDFGVKPPKLMFGTLKVHDPITVHYDVTVNR